MVDGHWKRLATSSAMLGVMVLLAGGLLALIGSTVFPQAALFVWAAVVLLVFLLLQLALFRLLGLRSRADELQLPHHLQTGAGDAATRAETRELPRRSFETPTPSDGTAQAAAADVAEANAPSDASSTRDWRAWRG